MTTIYVIEHGSDPRPARIVCEHMNQGHKLLQVEFTDADGGWRICFPSSVHPTKAEAVRAEREMEK